MYFVLYCCVVTSLKLIIIGRNTYAIDSVMNEFDYRVLALLRQQRERPEKF